VDEEAAPNCDVRPKPAELGMAPNVLERGLNVVPKPKDDEAVVEKEDVLEYGYASLSFFAD
jgi:hypothetical protein